MYRVVTNILGKGIDAIIFVIIVNGMIGHIIKFRILKNGNYQSKNYRIHKLLSDTYSHAANFQ